MWLVWSNLGRGEHHLRAKTAHFRAGGERRFLCGRVVPSPREAQMWEVKSGFKRCAVCSRRLRSG